MYRWDIINALIEKNNYQSYLEIGYYKGWSFDQIYCTKKVAVDPNPCKTPEQEGLPYGSVQPVGDYVHGLIVKLTSNHFFEEEEKWIGYEGSGSWDIIFIDGLHESEQVYRDIKNSLKHLSPNGTIVLHDCNPPTLAHTTTGVDGCWTGDTWKAFVKFRALYSNLTYCVDTDWGVGVITTEQPSGMRSTFMPTTDWDTFHENRNMLLNLITPELFKQIYVLDK